MKNGFLQAFNSLNVLQDLQVLSSTSELIEGLFDEVACSEETFCEGAGREGSEYVMGMETNF